MGRESVYVVTMPTQARTSLLTALVQLSLLPGRWGGGGSHRPRATQSAGGRGFLFLGSSLGGGSSCDSTHHLPEAILVPETKPWPSALPGESVPGALPHLTGRVGSVAKHLPSPQSQGELDWKTCSPTPLTVISSGTFPLH